MLTILHTESSDGWGGQEIRILRESLGMARRGHRVLIAAAPEASLYDRAKASGLTAIPFRFNKRNPVDYYRLSVLVNRERVDIVNTHSSGDSWVAGVGAKFARRAPLIIRTRHLSTPISRSFLSRILYDSLPDVVLTTGEEIRRRMIAVNRFRGERILSVPTGVDVERFDPEKVKPSLAAGSAAVGMVSVLRSWKGHEHFLRAVPGIRQEVPLATFVIVGDGPQRDNIRNLVADLGLQDRVLLLGHREDIPEVIASLDVLVHPSYANEGVPQSVLQALLMGKPVVAADVGGIGEVVRDGETGYLIPPKDPSALAAKVVALLRNRELGKRLADRGRTLVLREYSFESMLDRIEDLYRRLREGRDIARPAADGRWEKPGRG
ncbi:MAG: glycosyl transferase, group 1 [Deltaproteobacteria bacterium CSP1-8]|jgi:glycosyltransferase involved in cell wall biosynthesis|nr:MAG: glycosyl transferase, group 1 [Deltaproteobacteria bacterium CSP1-8]OGP79957.1 MAG: hypothetical protein A2Z13_09425 [Deltaproteobacteria bacterium RBG_16_64_85]